MKYYILALFSLSIINNLSAMEPIERRRQPSIVQVKINFSGIVRLTMFDLSASVQPGGTPADTLSFMGPHVKGRQTSYTTNIRLSRTPEGNGKSILVLAHDVDEKHCRVTGFGYNQLIPNGVLVIDKDGRATIESATTQGRSSEKRTPVVTR